MLLHEVQAMFYIIYWHNLSGEESAQFCKYCGSSLDKAPKE